MVDGCCDMTGDDCGGGLLGSIGPCAAHMYNMIGPRGRNRRREAKQ